jgi:hypothetical protein
MEFILNFAWVALAMCMVWLWLRMAPPPGSGRRVQLIALGLALVILLPVISMTDDLIAAKNPAEIDICLRRDHDWLTPHAVIPPALALTVALFTGLLFHSTPVLAAFVAATPALQAPALLSIDNRPPPAA